MKPEIRYILEFYEPHHRRSGSALKSGRLEIPGSIPSCASRPSRSDFSKVFSETRKYWLESLRKTPRENSPKALGLTSGQSDLNL